MKAISTVFLMAILWLMTGTAHATTTLTIGQPAPDFTLKDLIGAKHVLKDQRGKITVIAFLSVQCPISNAYNDRIRALAADYAQQNVSFLAINSSANEDVAEIKAHAEKQGFQFPILKDKGNKIADAYGAERTPEIFVVDAQGILRYHGRIDNHHLLVHVKTHDLRNALNELLAGKPVSVPEAKALGCIIKREQQAVRYGTGSGSDRVSLSPSNSLASFVPAYANTFALQRRTSPTAKKPMPKAKSASTGAASNIALLKPAAFPKLRDSYKGKVIVLNFWATWCAPCVAEMPEFIKLDADYRGKGVQVLAISADDTTDLKTLVTRFVKEKGMTFPVYVQDTDDPQQMIDLINKDWPGVLPATFIYDKQGKLILSRFGIIDRDLLVNTVEQALK
ncbi:MAG: redoxin domain-containing protein [Acidobacteria bacterium]|nr:redoxin domain-containing protein [Acidobacteriota bacterium]MBI3422717.1 redoxin domain-containing protein [Acidobacteriota bacterium]